MGAERHLADSFRECSVGSAIETTVGWDDESQAFWLTCVLCISSQLVTAVTKRSPKKRNSEKTRIESRELELHLILRLNLRVSAKQSAVALLTRFNISICAYEKKLTSLCMLSLIFCTIHPNLRAKHFQISSLQQTNKEQKNTFITD